MNTKAGVLTMANPTSAFFKAGPSLVPSPVTATTCLWSTSVLSIMPDKATQDNMCKAHSFPLYHHFIADLENDKNVYV